MQSLIKNQQQAVLKELLHKARFTDFGKKHHFKQIKNYNEFISRVSTRVYDDIKPAVEQLKQGAENIFWPGKINQFAVSSGTSGKGKHIPVTKERLKSDQRFMRKIALSYFKQRPNPLRIIGSHISMPGSVEIIDGNLIAEVSGLTAQHAPGWLRIFQVVSPKELTRLSFHDKFNLLLQKAISANIKVITASPSWILTLFQQVLKKTGRKRVKEVWPNLNLLICGGLKLANYKPQLQKLIGRKEVDFIETYGASEGYVGFSNDLAKNDLKMMTNNGIFFECIPNPLPDKKASGIQQPVPLWKVETGIPYALIVTTNAGLWRYPLNDIVEFTSIRPLRFVVKGRVNEMLDDYGEALYIYEAEQALKKVTKELGIKSGNFTIAATLKSEKDIPVHQWFVRFTNPIHTETLQKIGTRIDKEIQKVNRHYAIRRQTNALACPEITSITQTDINRWLEIGGKNKAQGKLPKILKEGVEILKNE